MMGKEIVIGKDFESHVALLMCQHNAKEITDSGLVVALIDALGEKRFREAWNVYRKERQRQAQFKKRILREMVTKK